MYTPVTIVCHACGHRNLPHRSPSRAAELVLSGQFDTCRGCGAYFRKFKLPERPVFIEALSTVIESPNWAEAMGVEVEWVPSGGRGKGHVPAGIGYPA